MTLEDTFATRFTVGLAVLGYTVKDAANALGETPRTIRAWMSGRAEPTQAQRMNIKAGTPLVIDTEWLFGGRGFTELFRVRPGSAAAYYADEEKGGAE